MLKKPKKSCHCFFFHLALSNRVNLGALFCQNYGGLFQSGILPPNSVADQKKEKKVFAATWFYFSPEFLNFALNSGEYQNK